MSYSAPFASAAASIARSSRRQAVLGLVAVIAATGCSSGPSRVQPPSLDAGDAAAAAMELYDKDGDGYIAGAELDAVPGIKQAMATIDVDPQDAKVSEDEIAARVEAWQATDVGIMSIKCTVTLDGRELTNAKIAFEPESFLGDDIQAAYAEIGRSGHGMVTVPKENRPSADTPPGLQLGLYRVRISKTAGGKETIPAKYNTKTILGQEISPDDPGVAEQRVAFELTSD